jgi:orotidine 5''-phosphate decarboxylase, subfamily 1
MNSDCNGTLIRNNEMRSDHNKIETTKLVVALDVPDASQAFLLADGLRSLPVWVKLGLELFTAEGPDIVWAMQARNLPVFLDLKFHDIPNTVMGAVRSSTLLGVNMCTLHSSGGKDMCLAAVEGRKQAAAKFADKGREAAGRPLLMAITVLTSQEGDAGKLTSLVVERALMAKSCGMDGIVCSGREVAAVKQACGRSFLCLCPGIRFAGADGGDDQARVCTPAQAVSQGADFLVMGRPITRAENPAEAVCRALAEMEQVEQAGQGIPASGS